MKNNKTIICINGIRLVLAGMVLGSVVYAIMCNKNGLSMGILPLYSKTGIEPLLMHFILLCIYVFVNYRYVKYFYMICYFKLCHKNKKMTQYIIGSDTTRKVKN